MNNEYLRMTLAGRVGAEALILEVMAQHAHEYAMGRMARLDWTVRQMADELAMARSTVSDAMERLHNQHVLYKFKARIFNANGVGTKRFVRVFCLSELQPAQFSELETE